MPMHRRSWIAATLGLALETSTHAQTVRRATSAALMNDLMSGKGDVGQPFSLNDGWGKRRHLHDFRGKVVLLYFGYITCPDVCPTDLAAIAELLQLLGKDADSVQPIFITLDPQRDTGRIMREYLAMFDSRIVGLRGTAADTYRVATAFKTYYEKVPVPRAGTYFIDHTAFIYLLNRDGKYVSFFPPGTTPQRMQVMVREVL